MTYARYGHTATLLTGGTVLVAGGEGQSISCGKACTSFIPTAKTEIYNETTGKFTAAVSLPRAVAYHSMTLLATGRALVDGCLGYTSTCCVVVNNAEVFTPQTMTFSPSSLNFGLLQIGLSSPSQTVTVTNVSSHSATITSIASRGDYSQSNTCPITPNTLNPGQNCTIRVTFTPTAAGTRTGTVTLDDNEPGTPKQTIAVTREPAKSSRSDLHPSPQPRQRAGRFNRYSERDPDQRWCGPGQHDPERPSLRLMVPSPKPTTARR